MIIELEGLTKFYGAFKALDGLSVKIESGAIGLLGPNGAGKSTLIKCLLGLVKITGGAGRVLGFDVLRQGREIRQRTGYMPEDDCYITGISAVESVTYSGELAGMAHREALRRSHEILDYVGLDEARYREVQTYSTGMKQRVRLAQSLIHDPELLFLDEPTNGMDPEGRGRMLRLIRDLAFRKNITVVLSSHLLHDIETVCDSVMILGRGRLLTHDRLSVLQKTAEESFTVHLHQVVPEFAAELGRSGIRVESPEPLALRLSGAANIPQTAFSVAEKTQARIRQILPGRNTLEEIFMRALTDNSNAHL